jgi:YD repeat-containing protein
MPISLAYHSSGVKVQEIASRVGMGWVLNGGGSIVCAVNGIPDLGFYSVNDPSGNGLPYEMNDGTDVFYYSFGNYNGKFIITSTLDAKYGNAIVKEVIKLDSNNLKIIFYPNDSIGIIDEWGNQYIFILGETATDRITFLAPPVDDIDRPTMSYYEIGSKTSWLLTSVKLNTGEVINLNYQELAPIYYDYNTTHNYSSIALWPWGSQFSPDFGFSSQRVLRSSVLSSITYPGGAVSFAYNNDRQDLQADKELTSVKIYSEGNVKGYRLNHSYRTAFNASNSPSSFMAKRLYLDSVDDISDMSAITTLYKLSYNEMPLPHRGSYNSDMWGYYNQTGNSVSAMPEVYVYPRSSRQNEKYLPFKRPTTEPLELNLQGRNMSVNPSLVQAGILTGITYATGGTTTFEYEPNEFLWYPENSSNIQDAYNLKAGGVRIKRIIHTDYTRSQIIKDFEYNFPFATTKTSGAISLLPIFSYPGIAADNTGAAVETVNYYSMALIRTVRDASIMGSNFNAAVGYRYVTIKTNNSGKTVYQFSFPGAYGETNDNAVQGCSVDVQGFCDNLFKQESISISVEGRSDQITNKLGYDLQSTAPGTYPFVGGVNYDWNRGMPIKQLDYDTTGKLVHKRQFNYFTITSNRKISHENTGSVCCSVKGLNYSGRLSRTATSTFLTGNAKKLKTQREVTFADGDSIVVETNMTYDPQTLFLTQKNSLNSKSELETVVYKYPHLVSGNVYTEMSNRNILAPVIEESTIVAGKTVKKLTTNFDMNWFADKHIIAPIEKLESYDGGTPFRTLLVKSYDATGHPLSALKMDGQYAYKWSPAGSILSEVRNAVPEETYYENFESTANATVDMEGANTGRAYYPGVFTVPFKKPNAKSYVIHYWLKHQGNWNEVTAPYNDGMSIGSTSEEGIDDITVIPADASVRTFAYDGVNGLTATIDSVYKKTTYQYDRHRRLAVERDRDGNITKSIRYSQVLNPDVEIKDIYLNNTISRSISKTNCATGFSGGSVTYIVPKGKYRSVTPDGADLNALAELSEYGQEYANIYATCIDKCEGMNRKMINGVCETGVKKITRSVLVDDAYDCYYRYYFSDGTTSVELLDGTYPAPCK